MNKSIAIEKKKNLKLALEFSYFVLKVARGLVAN